VQTKLGIFLAAVLIMGVLSYPVPINNAFAENDDCEEQIGEIYHKYDQKWNDLDAEKEHTLDALEEEFDEKFDVLVAEFEGIDWTDELEEEYNDRYDEIDAQYEEQIEIVEAEFDEKFDGLILEEEEELHALEEECEYDESEHDEMEWDEMEHDEMESDEFEHDEMESDEFEHDEMESDEFEHDGKDYDHEKDKEYDFPVELEEYKEIVLAVFTHEELEEILEENGPRRTASIIASETELSFKQALELVEFATMMKEERDDRETDKKETDQKEHDEESQVTICHFPPGLDEMPVTITVAESALEPHIEHGDIMEECEVFVDFDDFEIDEEIEEDGNVIDDMMEGDFPMDSFFDLIFGGVTEGGNMFGDWFGGGSDEDIEEFEEEFDELEFEDEPENDLLDELAEMEQKLEEKERMLQEAEDRIQELEDRLSQLEERYNLLQELLVE